MISFLKSLDTYNRDLKLSTHNSVARGCFNLLLTIAFVVLNVIYIFLGLKQPKLKRIEEMNFINAELLNLEEIKLEMLLVVTEEYSNFGKEDFHLCDLYLDNHYEDTSIKLKIISEENYDSIFIRQSNAIISYKAEDLHRLGKGYYNFFSKKCQKDSNGKILDSSFLTFINFDYINDGMLINRLNFDNDNSKKFLYEKQNSSYKIAKNHFSTINIKFNLNSLYDDFKGLFDFNSEISSKLKSKIKNRKKIAIKKDDYIFSTSFVSQESESYPTNNIFCEIRLELGKMSKIYIRNYYHFLYYIPMFFSIFISIMKSFNIINIIITYHYQYFYFLNNNCNIKYDSTKTLNSINCGNLTHNKKIYIESSLKNNPTKDSKIVNKDIFDDNYHKISNYQENQNMSILKNLDKSDTSSFNNKKSLLEEEEFSNDVNQDKDEDKNSDYILENNDLKYTKKDILLFIIPFRCCRSKKTNIKLEILKDVKHKLNYDKSSFCYLTNSITTYLIHNNIIKMFGKQGILEPIYDYDLNKFE